MDRHRYQHKHKKVITHKYIEVITKRKTQVMGSKTSSRHHITKRSTRENYYSTSYIQSPPSYEVNNVLKPPTLASN